ncbi:hypothetical protein EV121DRAFT_277567 [Schizophyllum commune]
MSSDPSAASAEDVAKQFVPVEAGACLTSGSQMISTDFACLLYGCYLVQLNRYFCHYSHRDKWLKLLAVAVTLVSGATIGFAMVSQYKVLVTNSGNPGVWMTSPWEFVMTPVTTGLSAFLVQLFFASRIAFFRRDIVGRILSATVSLVATLAFAGALADMAVLIQYVKNGFNALDLSKIFMVARIWTISSVICDILIAATMTVLLVRSRRQTHFRSTKEMLQRLILQSIETGTVTAFVMVLMLICYETMSSKNSSYTVWELAIGPLYGNVMLFVLNAREGLSSNDVHCNTNDIELDSTPLPLSFASRQTDSQHVQIGTIGGEVDITEIVPMLAGYASCLLYGYYLAQLHVYFNRHAHGDRWLKWLAISIAIISGLTIGFSMASQYVILVEHGGDPSVWTSSPWQLALGHLTTGFSASLVQLFFASRIARLRCDAAGKALAGLIILIATAAFSSAIAVTILQVFNGCSKGQSAFYVFYRQFTVKQHLWLFGSLACDTLITGVSCFFDYEQAHIDATRPRLHSLASKFIETGMILAVVMLLSAICYETMGARNLTYFIWCVNVFSFRSLAHTNARSSYGNVMLFILNSRQRATCEENTLDIELRSPPLSPGSPKMISHVLSIGAIDSKLSGGQGKTNDIVREAVNGAAVMAATPSDIARAYAPMYMIAINMSCLLHGCSIVQLCMYSKLIPTPDTQSVVVTAVAGIGTWFGVISQYLVLVRHSGNPNVWTSNPWQFLVTLGSTGLTALLVQLFFVSRIARFRRDIIGKIMATLITMVSILAFAGFLAIMVLYVKCGLNTLELETVLPKAVTRLWGVSSTICDVLIAAAMSYLLVSSRRHTRVRSTKQTIERLILQSVETGTITAVWMATMITCYETMGSRNTAYVLTLSREYSIGPLYANVLLFVLNSRERMAADEVRCTTSDIELSTMQYSVVSPHATIPASIAGDPKRRAGFTESEEDPLEAMLLVPRTSDLDSSCYDCYEVVGTSYLRDVAKSHAAAVEDALPAGNIDGHPMTLPVDIAHAFVPVYLTFTLLSHHRSSSFPPRNGPFTIAVNVSCLLYGCLLNQASDYFLYHSNRDKWLKYLSTAVFAVIAQYVVLVRESGNPMVWISGARLLLVPLAGSGLNALIVQLFFASRIARFCRDKVGNALAGIISLTALVAFGGSIADTMIWSEAKMQDSDTLHLCQKLPLTVARVWTVTSVICDVLIATTMIVLLARSREEAHFRTTRQMLKRLIIQSIETGSFTALFMILLLISYETMGTKNATYVVWEISLGPLYGNVMLFVLNSREGLAPDIVRCQSNCADSGEHAASPAEAALADMGLP